MSDDDQGKLPARSRKPVDTEAQAARANGPAVGASTLRDLQKAMEESDDSSNR
jgi:hypothetical protein